MRVLLAIDGSRSSDIARDLLAGLAWPEGSAIRVVGVVEHGPETFGLPWMPVVKGEAGVTESALDAQLSGALETAAREIEAGVAAHGAAPGTVKVDHLILRGHAARAIVDEAREFGAELVAVGSRGHGAFESMILGSTSAEVVDHAPCPVLVARASTLRSLVLADDGSSGARDAAAIVEQWPILAEVPATVVTVAEVAVPWVGDTPGMYGQVMSSYEESVDDARRMHSDIARRTAEQLGRLGRSVTTQVREGDPTAELVASLSGLGADLVVVGTRGHTGLTRMILGSVARKVLLHAPCSVLVVHEGVRGRGLGREAREPATEDVATGR
jgi:nucleotide-binding universal stress UspA family protein